MRPLFTGFRAARRGFGLLLEHPRLIPFALIPAVAAVALSALAFWAVYTYGFASRFEFEGWKAALTWLVRVLEFLVALMASSWLVLLLGFPLCDPLTSRAEAIVGGKTRAAPFFQEIRRALGSTFGMVSLGLVGAVFLGLLGLIPGLAVFTIPFTKFVWLPLFVAFDMQDPSMARRQLEFKQKLGILLRHPVRTASMGIVGTWLLAIPGINFVGLPVAALAGVVAVRELEHEGRLPR